MPCAEVSGAWGKEEGTKESERSASIRRGGVRDIGGVVEGYPSRASGMAIGRLRDIPREASAPRGSSLRYLRRVGGTGPLAAARGLKDERPSSRWLEGR